MVPKLKLLVSRGFETMQLMFSSLKLLRTKIHEFRYYHSASLSETLRIKPDRFKSEAEDPHTTESPHQVTQSLRCNLFHLFLVFVSFASFVIASVTWTLFAFCPLLCDSAASGAAPPPPPSLCGGCIQESYSQPLASPLFTHFNCWCCTSGQTDGALAIATEEGGLPLALCHLPSRTL